MEGSPLPSVNKAEFESLQQCRRWSCKIETRFKRGDPPAPERMHSHEWDVDEPEAQRFTVPWSCDESIVAA